jgi:hypothetical protein
LLKQRYRSQFIYQAPGARFKAARPARHVLRAGRARIRARLKPAVRTEHGSSRESAGDFGCKTCQANLRTNSDGILSALLQLIYMFNMITQPVIL